MKKIITSSIYFSLVLLFSSLFLVSCAAIGDIFGAGFYTGIFLVVIVIIVIVVLIARSGRK